MRISPTLRLDRAAGRAEPAPGAPPVLTPRPRAAGTFGLLLADLDFHLLYASRPALRILGGVTGPRPMLTGPEAIQARLRAILAAERYTPDLPPAAFVSSGRRYVMRPMLLESGQRSPILALLLEGPSGESLDLSSVGELFHLSPRERETVAYLIDGLTTREVAERMHVSPNTVKQFVRLIMTKMGVTTRTGIIGKLVGR